MLERSVLSAEMQAALLTRAGGNPLYAEEFVRMVAERGATEGEALPETVQGTIAARIDALERREKQVLHDAAVVGKVFWPGVVAAAGAPDPLEVEQVLHTLERREFVRRERRSSVTGETEYAFRHVLTRDVAYGQIPRGARAERHRKVADWIEALGRPDDHAELIAHHLVSALELARAAGLETGNLVERARQALRSAGEKMERLSAFGAAARLYSSALALEPDDELERAQLVYRYGRALCWSQNGGGEELAEARDSFLSLGDRETAAEAELLLAHLANARDGDNIRGLELAEHAVAVLEGAAPSRAKAHALSQLSRFHMLLGDEAAIPTGRAALELAETLALDDLRSHALNTIGVMRVNRGEPEGIADLEESLRIAVEIDSAFEILRSYNNLSGCLATLGEVRRAFEVSEEGLRIAERYGERNLAFWLRGNRPGHYYAFGEWDETLRLAEEFLAEVEAGFRSDVMEGNCRWARGQIWFARGRTAEGLKELERSVDVARLQADPTIVEGAVAAFAWVLVQDGRREQAAALADELLEACAASSQQAVESGLVALELDRGRELLELLMSRPKTPWTEAGIHVAQGDLARAGDVYERIGTPTLEASARLQTVERLLAEGRRHEADEQLAKALAFYRSVGATRYIRDGEALLSASG